MVSKAALDARTVPYLRDMCKAKGLSTLGKKAQLVDRLLAADPGEAVAAGPAAPPQSWESFKTLKEGYDHHASKSGYLNIKDEKALWSISQFLGLELDVIRKEMQALDADANDYISFAEFAMWADKHTVGITLGLDVPDKRMWQKGMPAYWTTIPPYVEPEPEAAAESGSDSSSSEEAEEKPSGFIKKGEDPDTSELEAMMLAAREFEWDKVVEVLGRHPGYVDMRPHYRRFAAIHQMAYAGDLKAVQRHVDECGADPGLLTKDGKTPEKVARDEGHGEVADYLSHAAEKAHAPPPAKKQKKMKAPAGRGGPAPVDPDDLEAANEIVEKAKWHKWDEMLKLMVENPDAINLRPPFRRYAAIHQAAFAGEVKILQLMVEAKADPMLLTRDKETPMQVALGESKAQAAEYLAKLDPDAGAGDVIQKAHGVIDAAKEGDWQKLWAMLTEQPDLVNVRPQVRNWGVLHQAAFHGDVEALRRLIEEFKADVKQKSNDGKTAMDVAKTAEKNAAAEFLEACTPTIKLEDDFVTYPEQVFAPVKDAATLDLFRQLLENTHKKANNWTRDRQSASGVFDPMTPVPTGYELVGAERNENPALWRIYQVCREVTRLSCKDPTVATKWQAWQPLTMAGGLDWSGFDYCTEANEWPLLHASIPEALTAIARTGFTMAKLGSGGTTGGGGLYGDGTYLADSVTKADEYARGRVAKGEFKGCRTAAIVRVMGGRHFYTDKDVQQKDKPQFAKRVLEGHCNSTVGDRLKLKGSFREYVIYDASATYLEYILFFRRKGVPEKHQ